jgi:hypothetical protein
MKHTVYRRVLFVRPSYWIVSDYVKAGPGAHTYDQAWHPDLDSNPGIDPKTQRVQTHFEGTANVQLVPADPDKVKANILDGWLEGRRAKYVTFRRANEIGDTTFDTIVYPTKPGDRTSVSVERLPVKGANGEIGRTSATALRITIGRNRTGYYYQSYQPQPEPVEFGGFAFDGETVYFETSGDGTVTYAALRNGRRLSGRVGQDRTLVQSQAVSGTLGLRFADGHLTVETSASPVDLTIHVPAQVTSTTVNGAEVPFSQKDGAVRIPLQAPRKEMP